MAGRKTLAAMAGIVVAGSALLAAPPGAAASDPGRAYIWGHNGFGQLGNNSTTNSAVPVAVDTSGPLAGRTVTAISTAGFHTCAVASGKAYCWGNNSDGRLGNNSTTNSAVPVSVDTSGPLADRTVTAISTGGPHTCAVASGKAYCWGNNGYGQLGNSSTTNSAVPVSVDTSGPLAGRTVTAISTGAGHSCAVADGRAYCWGWNFFGQLGNNAITDSAVPVAVDASGPLAGRTVTAISASGAHTCAVADGRAYCWGWNFAGQLGNNTTTNSRVPVAVDTSGPLAGRTVTAISTGEHHSCVVAEGRTSCWGRNTNGQLGNNGTTDSPVPVPVDTSGPLADRTVTGISAGGAHTCAVAEGKAYCWGNNSDGKLGNNSTTNSAVPVAVDTSGPLAGKTVGAIDAGTAHTAVLAAAVPQPPTGVTATAGNGTAIVSWTPPADDGGSPLLDYTVTATPGGATCATVGTSCEMTGLANGTGYTFTVTSRNAIGASAPSAPSAPVTPLAPPPVTEAPGKVRGIKVKVRSIPANRTVIVTWKRTAGATSYRVRISKPSGKKYTKWKKTTKGKALFKTTLRSGGKYRAQVRAVGPGGRGPITTKRFTAR